MVDQHDTTNRPGRQTRLSARLSSLVIKTVVALCCMFAACLSVGCDRKDKSSSPAPASGTALPSTGDKTFTDAAISLRYPSTWSIVDPDGVRVQDEGVTIRKGTFLLSAQSQPVLQASGVEGGRLYEYLRSSVVDIACLWGEGDWQSVMSSEPTRLKSGMTITDYYLDGRQLPPNMRSCLRVQIPDSGTVYVGSSSGLIGDVNTGQTVIHFYTAGSTAYLKGNAELSSALQEMRAIAEEFKVVFNPTVRSNGSSIVTQLRNAGFAHSLYASDNASYPGYDGGTYHTCSASDGGYSDYVTAFTESIKPADQQKLLMVLADGGWVKCRTASAPSQRIDKTTGKLITYTYPVDVYSRNGEILNVITTTFSGNTTVIVPWALRSTTP